VLTAATKHYKDLVSLTPGRERAVELLAAGATDQAVADALGVHRVTVTRWRLYHPAVAAALNQQRLDLRRIQYERLVALLSKAIDALSEELDTTGPGRARLALEILRLHIRHDAMGPTDPEDIIVAAADVRRRRSIQWPGPDREAAIDELHRQAVELAEDEQTS
jgi:hypothetical protein